MTKRSGGRGMKEWASPPIFAVCIHTEQRDPRESPERSFRYVDIAGIDREQKRIAESQTIVGKDAPSRARKVIRQDDVLVSTVRPNLNAVAIVPEDLDGEVASTGFCVLRANRSLVEPRYLFYRAISPEFIAILGTRVRGANYPAVSDGDVKNIHISLPPLSEQRRIVEILDQADHIRRLRAEANGKGDRILTALFIKMFGDPSTNPMGWPVATIGELSILGPQYGANARSVPLEPGVPRYIRITDILDDGRLTEDAVGVDLGEFEPYRLEQGDLLFARSGATVGKTYVHSMDDNPCVFAGYLIRFRLNTSRLHPLVAFSFTQTTAYRTWVESKRRTSAQPNINGQEYAGLKLPVPSQEGQSRFVDAYVRFKRVDKESQSSYRRLDAVFSVLLRSAFDGTLTISWREGHMEELLQEMQHQAKVLSEVL